MDPDFCPTSSLKRSCASSSDMHLRPGKRKDYTSLQNDEEDDDMLWRSLKITKAPAKRKTYMCTTEMSFRPTKTASSSNDSIIPEVTKPEIKEAEVIELSDAEPSHTFTTNTISRRRIETLVIGEEIDYLEQSLHHSESLIEAWRLSCNNHRAKHQSLQKEFDDYKSQAEKTISETESRVGSLVNELKLLKENTDASTTAHKHKISFLALRPLTLHSRYARSYQVELPSNSGEFEVIVNQFKNRVATHRPATGMPHQESPMYENIRVYRIYNPRLWAKYESEVDDIYGLCNGTARSISSFGETKEVLQAPTLNVQDKFNPMNECWLFHGVPTALKERISQQGIDPRYAGTHFGKLYGFGSYFAELSSKSDIYTKPDNDGTRCMFFCRVCLGEIYEAKTTLETIRMPPERPDNRGPYNSVKAATLQYGGRVEYPEYIVYLTNQVYPEFRIEYTHSQSCKCTHCKR